MATSVSAERIKMLFVVSSVVVLQLVVGCTSSWLGGFSFRVLECRGVPTIPLRTLRTSHHHPFLRIPSQPTPPCVPLRACVCESGGMIDDFGEEIPFEELDDCCQKDVLERRHNQRLKKELRVGDRSYERFDLQATVFFNKSKCACCSEPVDYTLLRQLRSEKASFCVPSQRVEEDREEPESESDDELLDDDFVSPLEQQRKQEFVQYQEKLQIAQSYGYACHVEDSLEHILGDINAGLDMVIHVYNSSEIICAKMDLLLEDLSTSTLGTKFRRIRYMKDMTEGRYMGAFSVKSGDVSPSGCILCFRGKTLCASSRNEAFAEGSTLFDDDVRKFLDNARMITTELPLDRLLAAGRGTQTTRSAEEEEEEVFERFCDDPNCTKRYLHEHVGRGASTASFLMDERSDGMAALGTRSLQRI